MQQAGLPVEIVRALAAAEAERRKRQRYRDSLRGSNKAAWDATDAEVIISGAAGTGKSRTWLEKLHYGAVNFPGFRGLILRKTRASVTQAALVTFERDVLGYDHPMVTSGASRAHRESYKYPNGSEIIIGGMDNPTRVFSTEYDWIYVQEAIELSLDEWESLLRALRNGRAPYHQLMGDTNPDSPKHWLKQRCDAGVTRIIYAQHEDNPRWFDGKTGEWTKEGLEYRDNILGKLSGVRRERLLYGRWVQAEGAVYEEFDERIHVIERGKITNSDGNIPYHWRKFRVVDFGYTNPFVCQWWAADDDGRLYLYREIYHTQRLVEDMAKMINRLTPDHERVEFTVADHDAEDRATLNRYGIPTIPAIKDVERGIQAVKMRLRVAGDGKPRLFVVRGALVESDPVLEMKKKPISTHEEFPAYIWQEPKDGRAPKEVPLKENDHGMDAIRYMCMALDDNTFGDIVIAPTLKLLDD